MQNHTLSLAVLLAAGGIFASPPLAAQSDGAPSFADPVRLNAGAKLLGERRLYPSPVYHDLDGDGLQDIVVGDLRGRLTVAKRLPGKGPAKYAEEKPVLAVDGKEIDFHNW
ncbi:MAG: hypothetical protein IPN34_15995 [Planctomycetes bacterium]|nr:hypothetical protein [Planctomycetota bacterium]